MVRRVWCLCCLFCFAIALTSCSDPGPGQPEALAQIANRIRAPYQMGEKQLQNLAYKSVKDIGDGRVAVFVDYDLTGTMPELGLFTTTFLPGFKVHTEGERYVFRQSDAGWKLE